MKLIHAHPLPKRLIRRKKHGFALISTLTLMMLLTLLAVGILAMVSSQNRIAMNTVLRAEARQQALVGLDAALGELQVELGPDKRVSASSGIISDSDNAAAQHLLGVWNSWDGPIYGKSVTKNSEIQTTYEKGRKSMFRRWLISSRDDKATRTLDSAENLCSRSSGRRVCMLGEGTLGKSLTERHYVYADLLTMPASGKNNAAFAWWICGENQKAKVAVVDPEESKDPVEILHRTWNAPGPVFHDSKNLDFLPEKIEQPAKILSLSSLPLLASAAQRAGMPYFFDVTTCSASLPVNVSQGGLKQDLCLLLNKESLDGTEFNFRQDQDCPIAEGSDVPVGSESKMPIGSWQNLHAYYNCWPNGKANGSDNFTARLIGSLNNAYTRMSGSVFDESGYVSNPGKQNGNRPTNYDSRAMFYGASRQESGYARTPIMLAFMSNFGLVTEQAAAKTTQGGPTYDLSMCFAPMFLWWNPYNVRMKVRGRQLWAQSVPYKTMWLQTNAISQAGTWNYSWSRYAMEQTNSQFGFGLDYGDFFTKSSQGDTSDIEFEPGEILFFSPSKARVTDDYSRPYSNPWSLGYHPSSVAGYKARFYSGRTSDPTAAGSPTGENINAQQFHVALRLGQGDFSGFPTDGVHFAPNHPECITVFSGYCGMTESNYSDGSAGKLGCSPQRLLLGWYDPAKGAGSEFATANWSTDGGQSNPSVPYYIGSIGVVVKSANRSVDSYAFPNKDYRSKIWQHSSPAMWGGVIVDPDDQQRAYNPYQLAILDVSAGFDSSPMDNIGNNGTLGITQDGEQVSYASVCELPMHPPFSLAGLAGMRLQPGWYKPKSSNDAVSTMRRTQYQAGVPGVGIGNAFADPCIKADSVYTVHNLTRMENVNFNKKLFGDFFDHGLLINDALWDRWFCSSVSDMPTEKGTEKAEDVLKKFMSGEKALPVARYKKSTGGFSDEDVIKRIMADDGWKYIAAYLMVDGGFNVNSVSEEAWAAELQGLAKRKLVSNRSKNKLSEVESGKSEDQVLFSRFMVSTTDKSTDSLGGYSMIQGSSSLRSGNGMTSAWGEVRMLEPEGIRQLAKEMVKQVRLRGPFLSMSDFINRRLSSSGEENLTGALQAAIDKTDINNDFNDHEVRNVPSGDLYSNSAAAKGSMYTAAPGYLIQSDVLMSLGNVLTVRDDTFTIRAYGCVRNPEKAVLAQAWCEAVVQRCIEYVDPNNKPEDSEYKPDGSKSGTTISDLNKVMGRRFRVVSFKWLDAWDI